MPEINKKPDRRTIRTKRALSNALVELIQEKHYDSITVQDIIDRADVARATFYTHYRDKEDLFRGDWEKFLGFFVEQFHWENISEGSFLPIAYLFEHLIDFHPFYRGLFRSGKTDRIFRYGQKHLAERIKQSLESKLSGETKLPIPVLSHYLSTEIFSVLKWWLDHNMPYPPKRMDEIFHTLVMPGFRDGILVE